MIHRNHGSTKLSAQTGSNPERLPGHVLGMNEMGARTPCELPERCDGESGEINGGSSRGLNANLLKFPSH